DNFMSGLGGNDQLLGQSGDDMLIGGAGADRLNGGPGIDILIAGSTAYDHVDAALRAIMAEWSPIQPGSVNAFVTGLRNGSVKLPDGTPVVLVKGSTVFDDLSADTVTGSNGPDWVFFDASLDVVTDLNPKEDVVNNGSVPPGA